MRLPRRAPAFRARAAPADEEALQPDSAPDAPVNGMNGAESYDELQAQNQASRTRFVGLFCVERLSAHRKSLASSVPE